MKTAKRKAGDAARIISRAWMDVQEKKAMGYIKAPDGYELTMVTNMQELAGELVVIDCVTEDSTYLLKDRGYRWEDWMFEDGELPDVKEAARAMLAGGSLYDDVGKRYWWSDKQRCFISHEIGNISFQEIYDIRKLPALYWYHEEPKERAMTTFEAMLWAGSEASHGWVVRRKNASGAWGVWRTPQYTGYDIKGEHYQRARLLPDGSGIDESTVEIMVIKEENNA